METSAKGNTGLIYVFTGDGKGKTSAALGVAMRAAGQGKRAAMVQWYKEKSKIKSLSRAKSRDQKSKTPTWQIGEHKLPELLKKPLFKIYPMGQGFYKLPTDHATPDEHKKAAQDALELAERLLKQTKVNRLEGYKVKKYQKQDLNLPTLQPSNLFLLILDESLNAVADKLIGLNELMNLLTNRGTTHVILTGRNCPKKLIALADLVTEMKKIKHPYDIGKKAVPGLDY